MPTFRSIGMQPSLSNRLVTKSIAASTHNDGVGQQQQLPIDQRYQLIETPQALLSRNPSSLMILNQPYHTAIVRNNNNNNSDDNNNVDEQKNEANSRTEDDNLPVHATPISLAQVQKLRQDVALALIDESSSGKRMKVIRDVLHSHDGTTTKRRRRQRRVDDDIIIDEPAVPIENNEIQQKYSCCLIHGTVSALDILRFEEITMKSKRMKMSNVDQQQQEEEVVVDHTAILPTLSTGCHQLDDLIALPNEHVYVTTSIEMNVTNNNNSIISSGIPFRYVTQFSGAPSTGKTQLALQLACSPGLYQTWYLSSNPAIHMYAARLSELASYYRQNVLLSAQNPSSMSSCYDGEKQHTNVPSNWKRTVTERTIFASVSDEYQVLSKLADLESFLINDRQDDVAYNEHWKPILLVLDSCSGCFSSSADSLLLTVASTIKRLTRTYGLATVLINGSVADRTPIQRHQNPVGEVQEQRQHDGYGQFPNTHTSKETSYQRKLVQQHRRALKPALGRSWWKMAADIHIWIASIPNGMLRATLERHPSKMVVVEGGDCVANSNNNDQSATFRISSQGIQGVSN